ncbi:MAG TPA: SDR family NAD(P)-dependent oxidoreductase [Thermoanaerobaculia bacterium]|nr:SDR family NAD(P)-dependent oxidoreductase [Thermoanaerobaculia bacterium]
MSEVAVVTGGSGGIGCVIVSALRETGATVVNLDLESADVVCDVRDDASVARAIARVLELHGRIDIVVHAAGIARDAVVWKLAVDDWDLVQQVNLRGAFLLLRHTIPAMRNGGGGRVILIGSINGSRGKFGTSAYAASKAGLIGFAKSVSRETGRLGIRINIVEPGWVRTPLTDSLPDSVRQQALDETLLGELVEPEDIAAAVVFLAGPGGRRMTGQVLRVDAGQYL